MIFHSLHKNNCFQNIKIKPNSSTLMTLMSLLVISQALEPLQPQWPLQLQEPPWPQWPIQPHFIKKWLILMTESFLAPQWPILVPYCGMDIRKSIFHWYLIPFLSEAVEASPCYLFQNWLMKLKCPNLLKPLETINQENYQPFYPSEPFRITRFQMRHPVLRVTHLVLDHFALWSRG